MLISTPLAFSKNDQKTFDSRVKKYGSMSTFQYFAGGVVGVPYGLGIGHMIQGRYFDTGYYFTLSQIAAIGLFAHALHPETKNSVEKTELYLSVFLFISSKILEVYDLWVISAEMRYKYRGLKFQSSNLSLGLVSDINKSKPSPALIWNFKI